MIIYAQALSTKKHCELARSHTHTHKDYTHYTNATKGRDTHLPALSNKKVSPITNYDTNLL